MPPGQELESRRARGNPVPEPIVPRMRHGAELSARMNDLADRISGDYLDLDDEDSRVVLKFHASTRLSNGPFSRLRFTALAEGDDWTYYVAASRQAREELAALLLEYSGLADGLVREVDWSHPKSWAEFIDRIEGIELYGPEDRRDPTVDDLEFAPTALVDCLLWPAPNEAIAAGRVNSIAATVNAHATVNQSVRVVALDPRPDRLLVRVAATASLLDQLLLVADIERVRAPLRSVISQAELTSAVMPPTVPEAAATSIGVVDGIIVLANPLIGPYLHATASFPDGHTFAGSDPHGTAVASVAIWGNLDPLVTGGSLAVPHPVVSARVLEPTPSGHLSVVGLAHVTIEEAIRWLVVEHHVRIINLSINQPVPAAAPLRDELTVTVDTLARELNVVIVVSAGNRINLSSGHWLHDYPSYLADSEARIAAPGDAALAVTVGSHAVRDVPGSTHAGSHVAIAASHQPSPFSRTGPTAGVGRRGSMKPEFTGHGGNWGWDHQFGHLILKDPGLAPIVAIEPVGGRIVGSQTGTSFAAPAVAHEIARVAERYPGAGANLLRALTALSARPLAGSLSGPSPTYQSGYGEPQAERVLESSAHRVFLTFEGSLPTNRVVVHRVPIPPEFADGTRERTFRVALAFDPPVRRGRREYVAGSMTVELVRGMNLQDVEQIYTRQPSRAQVDEDPTLVRRSLPPSDLRPELAPGSTVLESNTLIRREFKNGAWDPEHSDYFLVVTHNLSPWTQAQRSRYTSQTYALALEIAEESESDLDLYAAIRIRLRPRARLR